MALFCFSSVTLSDLDQVEWLQVSGSDGSSGGKGLCLVPIADKRGAVPTSIPEQWLQQFQFRTDNSCLPARLLGHADMGMKFGQPSCNNRPSGHDSDAYVDDMLVVGSCRHMKLIVTRFVTTTEKVHNSIPSRSSSFSLNQDVEVGCRHGPLRRNNGVIFSEIVRASSFRVTTVNRISS